MPASAFRRVWWSVICIPLVGLENPVRPVCRGGERDDLTNGIGRRHPGPFGALGWHGAHAPGPATALLGSFLSHRLLSSGLEDNARDRVNFPDGRHTALETLGPRPLPARVAHVEEQRPLDLHGDGRVIVVIGHAGKLVTEKILICL